jgi:hypothetical protein
MMNESRKKALTIPPTKANVKGKLKGFKSLFLPSLSQIVVGKSRRNGV